MGCGALVERSGPGKKTGPGPGGVSVSGALRASAAVKDALVREAESGACDGTPTNPGAWIVATARNRAIDRIRREQTLARKTELLARAEQLPEDEEAMIPDERLELIFACCHPALAADAQVALTLSLVGGLTTPEIARAFIVPEATLAQRLVDVP